MKLRSLFGVGCLKQNLSDPAERERRIETRLSTRRGPRQHATPITAPARSGKRIAKTTDEKTASYLL